MCFHIIAFGSYIKKEKLIIISFVQDYKSENFFSVYIKIPSLSRLLSFVLFYKNYSYINAASLSFEKFFSFK